MPKPSATTPFHLIYGGDPYLNEQTVRDLRHQAQRKHPDAETIELDATNADHYAFDEAVSPSLLSERSIVIVSNLQNADDKLGETMVAYCKQAVNNPAEASIVICQHEGGIKATDASNPWPHNNSWPYSATKPANSQPWQDNSASTSTTIP